MSRQSKAAKKNAAAKQISAVRKGGGSGPAKTKPLHGKDASKRLYTAKRRGPDDKAPVARKGN
jgi:hypothetical protein